MARTVINPPGMAAPVGYSHAIRKQGTPVFLAGQVALDHEGRIVGENDVAAQVEQAFANVRTVVEAAGGTLEDVVKITIYVTDASYRPAVAAARQRWFRDGVYPASTYLVVSALAVPQLLVEIEAIAMIE
jgi:enamine deaminase RidA (YjgF/YER057c/UK114 family)